MSMRDLLMCTPTIIPNRVIIIFNRFWHGQQLSEVGNKESGSHEIDVGGGHNRIFHTTLANTSQILNDTITAQIILSGNGELAF